jgi:hypothetical protein
LWLRRAVAFVWVATGLSAFHPEYRRIGHDYLARLGLPDGVMYVTCFLEVLLGLRVALGPASTWVTALQIMLVLGFTTILAILDPVLLVHPFGALTKNVPLLAVVCAAWLLEREGWCRRALWLLRGGVAAIWITEGILPKVLFQQRGEVAVVANSGLVPGDPAMFLWWLGVCQAASGAAVLVLDGRPLRFVLACQAVGLVVLPLLVSYQNPLLWVEPFGPLIKNVPILAGTLVLWRQAAGPPDRLSRHRRS